MTTSPAEILLVEDNPADLELTMHAFRSHGLATRVHVVRDGAEAIDYLFSSGANGRSARKSTRHSCGAAVGKLCPEVWSSSLKLS